MLEEQKLSVHHIIALAKIRDGADLSEFDGSVIQKLLEAGAIKRNKDNYLLSDAYIEITEEVSGTYEDRIIDYIKKAKSAKMGDIIALFGNRLTRRQVNNTVFNLVKRGTLAKSGKGFGTFYMVNTQVRK